MVFITVVKDYHEFESVLFHFKNAGFKLKYKEVGYGDSKYGSGYHAIFYEKLDKDIKEQIKNWTAKLDQRN